MLRPPEAKAPANRDKGGADPPAEAPKGKEKGPRRSYTNLPVKPKIPRKGIIKFKFKMPVPPRLGGADEDAEPKRVYKFRCDMRFKEKIAGQGGNTQGAARAGETGDASHPSGDGQVAPGGPSHAPGDAPQVHSDAPLVPPAPGQVAVGEKGSLNKST